MKIHHNDVSTESIDLMSSKVGLIILNNDLITESEIHQVWKLANVRVCADGGANKLYDLFLKSVDRKISLILIIN